MNNERYNIDHHPDMLYELRHWDEIREEMGYPAEDNNNGYVYGVYWLDDNGEVVDVEWFKTDDKRFEEINKTNDELEG